MEKGKLKIFVSYFHTAKTHQALSDELFLLDKIYQNILIVDLVTNQAIDNLKNVKQLIYKNNKIDVNQIIRMNPDVVVINDITNNKYQCSNQYRYQDVVAILDSGIDCYTTLNVYNLNSSKYLVDDIIDYNEINIIPDYIFNEADEVFFVDFDYDSKLLSKDDYNRLRSLALKKVLSHHDKSKVALKFLVVLDLNSKLDDLIINTAKLSATLCASFEAVYIDNNDNNQRTLNHYQQLIRNQDGRLVRIFDPNPHDALLEYIKDNEFTDVFVIKHSKYYKMLVNKLDCNIHLSKGERTFASLPKITKNIFMMVFALIITTLINVLIVSYWPSFNVGLLFLVASFIVYQISDYKFGLLTIGLSIFLYWLIFLNQEVTFNLPQLIVFSSMFVLSFIITIASVTASIKVRGNLLYTSQIEKIHLFNQEMLEAQTKDDLFNRTIKFFKYQFDINLSFYQKSFNEIVKYSNSLNQQISDKQAAVIKAIYDSHQVCGHQQSDFSSLAEIYYPVVLKEDLFAVVEFGGINDYEAFYSYSYLIDTFLVQFGLILEKNILTLDRERLVRHVKNEVLKNDFLNAIAHDIRTPLQSIYSNVEALLEAEDKFDIKALTSISNDVNWVIRMVENLLVITRLSRLNELKMNREVVDEIISDAVYKIKRIYPDVLIDVIMPDKITICRADGILIRQVLINLLDNAIRHNKDSNNVKLIVSIYNNQVVFKVIDQGISADVKKLNNIFSEIKDGNLSEYNSQIGIGLCVCRAILKAHHSQFGFYENKDQGLTFFFSLGKECSFNGFK